MAPSFPLDTKHDAYIRSNTPMQRYDVSCSCGWRGYADTFEECEDAHKAHVNAEKGGVK